MEPEAFSRQIGNILGSAPFTMDERDQILEAMGKVNSISEMPKAIQKLLSRRPEKRSAVREKRAARFSTVERRIIKDSDQCPLCVANNDPRNVPVHPNCRCDVVTDSIEAGMGDREHRLFNPLTADDIDLVGDFPEDSALQLDPATAAALDPENARWADLERWLTQMQPYLESGEQYVSIVVDDDADEAVAQIEETISVIAEDAEQLTEELSNRKLWFAIGKAVVL